MNVSDTFRNLVTGQFLPELNYSKYKFSFKTVFYQTAYFYRCCECAFEHEYLDYITASGTIYEERYNKVLRNINSGKCPHVEEVNESYVRETSIRAIHIAAAIGPKEAVQSYLNNSNDLLNYEDVNEGMFSLSPFRIAIFKGNIDSVALLCDSRSISYYPASNIFSHGIKMKCAYKTEGQPPRIKIDVLSPIEFCMRGNNKHLLKAALTPYIPYWGINKALEYTFSHNRKDMQDELLEYIADITDEDLVIQCTVSTIVYDQPNIFNTILQKLLECSYSHGYICMLWTLLNKILNRKACADILQPYTSKHNEEISTLDLLQCLDVVYHNFEDYIEEVAAQLKTYPQIREAVNMTTSKGSLLHTCTNPRALNPEKVAFLLNLGINVDTVDMNGKTALFYFVRDSQHFSSDSTVIALRVIIERLLYENPSVDINKTVVELAIKLDQYSTEKGSLWFDLEGEFVMDNQVHSKTSGSSSECCAGTDFFAPLLIECGFPVKKDLLDGALEKPLPACELDYIRHYLIAPRSLMHRCRDVIRSHYKRRQVHRFVEVSDVPKKIKDFILLKPHFVKFD